MDKIECFIIKEEILYLDKVLVSFNELPIFFICVDKDNARYLVLCYNYEDFNYIIVRKKNKELLSMLNKKNTMREVILNSDYYWDVKTGKTEDCDDVNYCEIKIIDKDILPAEGAFFEVVNESDKKYIENVELECLNALEYKTLDNFFFCG